MSYKVTSTTETLLREALKPFAAIADEYDNEGLDEARPYWVTVGAKEFDPEVELYCGRGGKTLIKLIDVLRARAALEGKAYTLPQVDAKIAKIRALYEASIPNLPWNAMSEDRRNDIIKNYEKLL